MCGGDAGALWFVPRDNRRDNRRDRSGVCRCPSRLVTSSSCPPPTCTADRTSSPPSTEVYLGCISGVSRVCLGCISIIPLRLLPRRCAHLGCISRLYLGCISGDLDHTSSPPSTEMCLSRVYLGCISGVYRGCISAVSRQIPTASRRCPCLPPSTSSRDRCPIISSSSASTRTRALHNRIDFSECTTGM